MMKIQRFINKLNSCPPQSIFNFEDDFRDLMIDFDISSIVKKQLTDCLSDYRKVPPSINETTVNLISGTWFDVFLTVNHLPNFLDTLITHTDSINCFLSSAELNLYSLKNFQNDIFNYDARIELTQTGTLNKNDILVIDSSKHIMSLKSDYPIVFLSISNKVSELFGWRFQVSSRKPLCHFNINPVTTVLELMSKFLGIYGGEESTECLETLITHPSDTIKWQAAAALAHINQEKGVMAFQQLALSANPMLANAAISTLSHSLETI